MSGLNRRAAFRSERADLLAFCASLGPADWRMNSRAAGWSIQDCVAHLASGCHALFGTGLVKVMRSRHIEQFNDDQVELRRDRLPAEVLGEYRRWSRLLIVLLPGFSRGPMARVEVRLAELGRFPARLVPSAAVFDHHTHLRHDMAPALSTAAPDSPISNSKRMPSRKRISMPGWRRRSKRANRSTRPRMTRWRSPARRCR